MEAFSRLSSLLMDALEAREPTVDLLDSFIDHWKSITNYYVETTDDSRPVRQTDIPWHLKQMLDILVYEDKQQGAEETGSCLEYLLQHKLLETLGTLGKAQYPPGMGQQVLVFFSSLLSQMLKPLLHLANVYRPVQNLIRLCALPGSHFEKEAAQFLLVVCTTVQQDPSTLSHVFEILDQPAARTPAHQSQPGTPASDDAEEPPAAVLAPPLPSGRWRPSGSGPVQPESGLLAALLAALLRLSSSPRGPVRLKARQSFLLLSSLPGGSGEVLCDRGRLGELLAGRLLQLYALLPLELLDPAEVQSWSRTAWSSQFSRCSSDLRSEGHLTNFFSWLDFLDHLMREAPEVVARRLADCVHQLWLLDAVQGHLQQPSEQVMVVSTSLLCAVVRLVQSWFLLDRLVQFLLGTQTVTRLLLQRCDHVSDQVSLVSLCLVEELLRKPHRDILDVLVLRFLEGRGYLAPPPAGQEDGHPEGNEDSDGLEDDPFFSDSLCLPPHFSSSSSRLSPPTQGSADVINSFLCLVPVQVRSAQLLQEGGYESYVYDAHKLVTECRSVSLLWEWPLTLPPASSSSEEFFEGHLLKVLLDRLGHVLEQPYEVNLQLTAVLSRLSAFNHPLLQEYLLDPYVHLSHCSRSLFSVLVRLMGELVQRVQQVPRLPDRLLSARRHLLGLDSDTRLDHLTLLRGIIVLEEFSKELAAIAFVQQTSGASPEAPGTGSPGVCLQTRRRTHGPDADADQNL